MKLKTIAVGLLFLVLGCTATVKTLPVIDLTPTTASIARVATVASNAATSINTETKHIETSATQIIHVAETQPKTPAFTSIISFARNILASNAVITEQSKKIDALKTDFATMQSSLGAIQLQVDQQRKDAQTAIDQKNAATKAAKEAQDLYHDSWFGGRFWRLCYWVAGVITAILVIDTLLFFFTQSASLNPLTLITFAISSVVKLITGLFTKKPSGSILATAVGAPLPLPTQKLKVKHSSITTYDLECLKQL